MTADGAHILLLAGTAEARQLAARLAANFPHIRVTASFAGAVSDLPDLGVPARVGGFGGVSGLTDYLTREEISLVIDATHPFAVQMSRNAWEATSRLGLPLIRLERPAWTPVPGDNWLAVSTLETAANALPADARAFLAIGRKDIHRFAHRSDLFCLARMIEPPGVPLPDHWALVLARPPQTAAEEIRLFRQHRITHVVTKNSGGGRSYPKLEAARELGLPVVMVERPKLPAARVAAGVDAVVAIVAQKLRPEIPS